MPRFSVGRVLIHQNQQLIKEISLATDINIQYEVTTVREIGSDGVPIDETKEEERFTITCTFVEEEFDTSLITGEYYDVTVYPGINQTGIPSITFTNCRITGYTVRQTQDTFVEGQLTFSKVGKLDTPSGTEPARQRVKFENIYLGDYATVSIDYEGNTQSVVIPTALGVLIRSTQDMGGGQLTITVRGYAKKDTRLELERYLINLYTSLPPTKGTLTVEFGDNYYTIPDCYLVRAGSELGRTMSGHFNLVFVKSAY